MAQEFAQKFYNSKAWIKTRNAYRQSRYMLCEKCSNPGDEVHHKVHLTPSNIHDPDIALNWSNLELLCHVCHMSEHGNLPTTPDTMFDSNGELVQR